MYNQHVISYEINLDKNIDRWHDGWFEFRAGKSRPSDRNGAEGWDDAKRASGVRVVMPARPEGYYHSPVGTYD